MCFVTILLYQNLYIIAISVFIIFCVLSQIVIHHIFFYVCFFKGEEEEKTRPHETLTNADFKVIYRKQ